LYQILPPASYRESERTTSAPATATLFWQMWMTIEGTSAGGRPLYLVRLRHGGQPMWRIMFYAQQHGNEVSSKDALLYLVRDIARKPEMLPRDVELWVMPMVNPDGAVADTRRNGAGADLNRDHIVLEQPETQALHRVVRRFRPHLAVDCHEFTRDPEERRTQRWIGWPDITMDGVNNPLFDAAVIAASQRWVDESAAAEEKAEHAFLLCNGKLLDKGSIEKIQRDFEGKCLSCGHPNQPIPGEIA
jgi:murein tripeptide amidase MpaA